MSQYTISIKSIINIESHLPPFDDDVFANTEKKIERGRQILFNFDYEGGDDFKRLFEESFIIKNLEKDIYCYDVDLFLLTLKNEVQKKAGLYYKKYSAISDLALSDLRAAEKSTLESEGTAKTSSKNKTLSSQFPRDIADAEEFSDVKHLDNGGMGENSGDTKSTTKSTQTTERAKLDNIDKFIDAQRDVITDFVNDLNELFVQLW